METDTSVGVDSRDSQKERTKERNRIRVAVKRAMMSEDEKKEQRELQRVRALSRRKSESLEEKHRRRERERIRSTIRRKSEDASTREQRLKAGRERAAKKRELESTEEREQRLRATRERLAFKRKLRKKGFQVSDLRKGPRDKELSLSDLLSLPQSASDDNAEDMEMISIENVTSEVFPGQPQFDLLSLVKENNEATTDLSLDSEENQQQQIMSRLISSSSSNSASATATNQKQLQQMLSAGTIQAQEQQVTSLRELLRQEEKRLEMLKQMRSTPGSKKAPPPPSTGTVHVTGIDSTHGVIRSTHGIIQSTRDNSTPISSRLQQLVDSVAVNQMSSKASQLKSSLQTVGTNQTAIQQSKASSLTIPQNGIQRGAVELDEATILRTIENSSRYRDFLVKQSNLKRNFQKQIDKKIGSAPYPKTFRQVWPIIPVHDPSFVKNIGLETVTLFFDPAYKKPIVQPSKMKPTCNQCGCDFASAWQIRKNNSKQVLLCESCDFTNLKLFQRSKLATQLKELMENVQKEEEKFKEECDETKKQTMAVERAALLNPKQQPVVNIRNAAAGTSQDVSGKSFNATSLLPNGGTPHIATVQPGKTTASAGSTVETEGTRKRKSLEDHGISKVARTTANLNHTLNKISQQLVRKQVDEKVGKRQQHQTVPTHVVSKPKGPPPLKQVSPLNKTAPVQIPSTYSTVRETTTRSTPPPLINSNSKGNNSVGNESRKSRRKGTPRHKLMGGSD